MKISGFTMVKNADKYYFPVKESIESILPIVDEFVIALGDNDPGDKTRELIESIETDKIKIIDRVWSKADFVNGNILAKETSFALSQCTGDWCLYLQADEVIHEKDHETIVKQCRENLKRPEVDGLLFDYNHFFGDYDHRLSSHGWYKNEIRVVRNNANIYSYKDAQSFRKNDNEKLNVVRIGAEIYHYGWVRPPELMETKKIKMDTFYHGDKNKKARELGYDYGPLGRIPIYKGSHPKVMGEMIDKLAWKDRLNYSKRANLDRPKMKHEKLKYRIISALENALNGGQEFWGYSNWNLIK